MFAITNNVVVNISVAISLQPCANISVGQTPKIELHFKLIDIAKLSSKTVFQFTLREMCERAHFSTLFATPDIMSLAFLQTSSAESGVSLFYFALP